MCYTEIDNIIISYRNIPTINCDKGNIHTHSNFHWPGVQRRIKDIPLLTIARLSFQ